MKKGIIINFLQTNAKGPALEIEFKEVTDELCVCEKCGAYLCHGAECGPCAKEEEKRLKELEKEAKNKEEKE